MSFPPPPPPPPPPGGRFPPPPPVPFVQRRQKNQANNEPPRIGNQSQQMQQSAPTTFSSQNVSTIHPPNGNAHGQQTHLNHQQTPPVPAGMNGNHAPQYHPPPPPPHGPPSAPFHSNYGPPPIPPPPSRHPPPMQQHYAPPPPGPPITHQHYPPGPPTTFPPPPPHAPPPPMFSQHIPPPLHHNAPPPPTPPPPMQQQQQPPHPSNETTPKINPSQIPRPPLFTRPQTSAAVPIYYPGEAVSETHEIIVPPPADTRFVCHDDGNASPHIMRSTMYAIPRDRTVWRNKVGQLDMGILCTPMAVPSQDYVPRPPQFPEHISAAPPIARVPLHTASAPVRCRHCHAYANAYWGTDGVCNFCGHVHRDLSEPAVMAGTVDYEVSGPYVTRATTQVGAISIYALDATSPQLRAYVDILKDVGVQMGEHFQRQQGPLLVKPRIGCVLVSNFGIILSYFTKNGELACSIMSDVAEDPFCPLPVDQWTFDVSTTEGIEAWNLCMTKVWTVWQPVLKKLAQGANGHAYSHGGAALSFMAHALEETGGRATWISWRRPNFGVGNIRDRELNDLKFYAKEFTERPLYCPLQTQKKLSTPEQKTAEFYKKLGQDCAKNRICVDIIMHTMPIPMAFLDLGTLCELCRISSGNLKWIRALDWKEQFKEELCRPILSFFGTDVIFKIRCSEGIDVKSYLSCTAPGNTIEGGIVGTPELELSVMLPNTCIGVELEHRVGGIHKSQKMVYIQAATLYTAINGRRRVRVSTLALRVSSDAPEIFRCTDFGAYAAFLSRRTVTQVLTSSEDATSKLDGARQHLMKTCVHLLACYRLHTEASSSPPGQLLLPSKFQLLPLFIMSMLKSNILRSALPARGSDVRVNRASPNADERAFALFHAALVTPACAMLMVHPNIFPLTRLVDGAGDWQIPPMTHASSEIEQAARQAYVRLPNSVNPSIACLDDDEIYLIDDGMSLFVLVGQDVNRDVKAEMIESDSENVYRVSTSSDAGQKILRLLWQMRTYVSVGGGSESSLRPTYPPTIVVLQHSSQREIVMKLMVDDTISGCVDYTNFLVDIHKRVRLEVNHGE